MGTLETLQGILAKDFRVPRDRVTAGAELRSLGIDSLDVLELLFKIEDAYGITIKEDTPSAMVTIGDVVIYIDGLLTRATTAGTARRARPAQPDLPLT